MPNSHKSRGEFGLRTIRYVSYPYAVVGEIAIGFSANRVQRASYPMLNSHKSRGEFGLRTIRYVSYPYAVVGEIAIGFSANRVQRASYPMLNSHKSRGIRLLASNGLLSPCFAMYTKNADKNIHSCRRNGYIIIC